jgi:acetyl-CoA carboxylase biotin carboxyl carrier protein
MKTVKSEMAGTLVEVNVNVGDSVTAGQQVAVIESMKMEVPLHSSAAGKVSVVKRAVGDFVNEGDVVLELS